jgi:hypothetical protein
MKPKKIILLATLLSMFAVCSYAQKSSAIIRGGVNFANVSNKDNGGYDDSKMLTSWQAGVIGDFNLTEFLAIQPGLLYSSKGIKFEGNGETLTFNPQYLELPVNLVFKTPTGATKFFAGAGPYVAMGVGGKFKGEGTVDFERKIDFSDDDPLTGEEEDAGAFKVRRFDYGLNGLVGLEVSNMVFTANYGLGLAKIQSGSNSSADDANKHRVLSLTLGFKF